MEEILEADTVMDEDPQHIDDSNAKESQDAPSLPEGFSNRVDAVFGALGGTDTWSLKQHKVTESGRDATIESDEEADKAPAPIMSAEAINSDGEAGGFEDPKASNKFRKSFEDEAEEDEFDYFATHTMKKTFQDEKPSKDTQVPAGNHLDKLTALRKGEKEPEPVEEDNVPAAVKRPRAPLFAGSRSQAEERPRAPLYTGEPPTKRRGADTRPLPRLPPPPPLGRSGRGHWRNGRPVPDHVRNPDRWTCYELDEALYVGGGGRREENMHDMHRAVASARDAARPRAPIFDERNPEPERHITEFGSGIEFRPRAAQRGVKSQVVTPPGRWNGGGDGSGSGRRTATVVIRDDDDTTGGPAEGRARRSSPGAEPMDTQGAEPSRRTPPPSEGSTPKRAPLYTGGRVAAPRSRQYRSKGSVGGSAGNGNGEEDETAANDRPAAAEDTALPDAPRSPSPPKETAVPDNPRSPSPLED